MELLEYENELYAKGYTTICGVDEAGRGPLAGPVCAGAVILKKGQVIEGVNDSKKLSEKKREKLFDVIKEEAVAYGIGWASVEEIEAALRLMLDKIPADHLWVNPDCGLKTRGETETVASLKNMVQAAKNIRNECKGDI